MAGGRPSLGSVVRSARSELSSVKNTIGGSARGAEKQFFSDITDALDQLQDNKDGNVTLSSGKTVNVKSPAGLAAFTTHLQLLQSHLEFVTQIHNFVKSFESKLQGLLGS